MKFHQHPGFTQPRMPTVASPDLVEAEAIITLMNDFNIPLKEITVAKVDAFAHSLNQQQLGIAYEALFDPQMPVIDIFHQLVLSTLNGPPDPFLGQPIVSPSLVDDALAIQLVGSHPLSIWY